jgi:hypothetical protein
MTTLSPTLSTIELLGNNDSDSAASSVTTVAYFYVSSSSIELKGVNVKNELREEGALAIDLLVNGEEVQLRNFKTLSAMINELRYNEASRLEIEEAANKAEVSFEIMALKAIMLATEVK